MSHPAVAVHRFRRMVSRDPHERNRTATTLELLYDLTVVVAFSAAASQLAHLVAVGHVWQGIATFAFSMFGVVWAWISYSWFMSAYDTDDWFVRIATGVQMVGVCILTLGIAPLAHGLDDGWHLDNAVMVGGYVVMRLSMVALWLRVAVSDPSSRRVALGYVVSLLIAQAGWILLAALPLSVLSTSVVVAVLYVIELSGPYLNERHKGGTPWHPHHIAERYGLLVIIALGEVILGTVEAVQTLVEGTGWTLDAGVLLVAGLALAFALWWTYFTVPFGDVLHASRSGSFVWGYSQPLLFAAIAAAGGGLHVAALWFEGHSPLSELMVVASIGIPVLAFGAVFIVSTVVLMPAGHVLHTGLAAMTVVVLGAAFALAAAGVALPICLVVLVLAPVVWVVAYELVGHSHIAAAMTELERSPKDAS